MRAFIYSDNLKVKDALQIYFAKYHFKDGGYNLKWFRIKMGIIFIPLPNIKVRVDAVKIHDIHHLITEYEANWRGETEIGAWEIASGCEKYSMAWLLNLGSFFVGMVLFPRYVFAAFLRGRKCATNLYFQTKYDDVLLNKTLGELRTKIEIDFPKKSSFKDYLFFAWWCLITLIYHFVFVFGFLYLMIKLGIYIFGKSFL